MRMCAHIHHGPRRPEPFLEHNDPCTRPRFSAMSFVPDDFDPPLTLEGPGFHLEPLGPVHNERDHAAWMSSVDHINATPGFGHADWDDWPVPMSLEKNLEDMVMHARHFEERRGFTYSVLDGDDVIGCLYIYPTKHEGHDADVASWVTASRASMDVVVWRAISDWLGEVWPFTSPRYAERA